MLRLINEPSTPAGMKGKLHIAAIVLVLLFFATVPLMFIVYGALSLLLGGLLVLAPLIALQFIVLRIMQHAVAPRESQADNGDNES